LIRKGRIVTAVDEYEADILIRDGRIHTIGVDISVGPDVVVHDAGGLLVLPGGVDVHTHLDWEFGASRTVDTFATGTKAAAFGGTTSVIDFCNQNRGESPLVGLEDWHRRRANACVDVGAHMILLDVNAHSLADMKTLIHREGVTSFKLFMAYPGVLMVDDGALFKAMRIAGANDAMICVHAENGLVIQVLTEEAVVAGRTSPKYHMLTRPTLMEGEATHRAIRLAELADTSLYVVHLSAGEALAAVTEARDRGIPVHAETCPQYLFLTSEEYDRPGFEAAKFVMTPPLRDAQHQRQLWRGLRTNDLQVVSTDHCPFCFNEQPYGIKYSKRQGSADFTKIPNGAPGIETRLRRRRAQAWHVTQSFCRHHRHCAGQAVRPVSEKGHDRCWFGCRHCALRCRGDLDHPRDRASQPDRLQPVRGPAGHRARQESAFARRVGRRW
jgi:dihydropyrimidinase